MSLPTQTKIRLPKIKKGLMDGLTLGQIADICKVTERTINRDKDAWLRSGDFEIWLRDEWLKYLVIVGKEDPVEVFRQLSKLVGKQIAERVRAEIEEDVRIEIAWKETKEEKQE